MLFKRLYRLLPPVTGPLNHLFLRGGVGSRKGRCREVMPTSSEVVGVAQEPGEAQRMQKTRGSPSGVVGGNENSKELQNAGTDSTLLLAVGSATPVYGTNLPVSKGDEMSGTTTDETVDDVTAAIATAAAVETVKFGASGEECTAPASAAEGEEDQGGEGGEGRQAPPAATEPAV